MNRLYYNTITPLLLSSLKMLIEEKAFEKFRLVGGTALSLYRGHRMSVDIDLFTDAPYGSIDFTSIEQFLKDKFSYVITSGVDLISFGNSYFIGKSEDECIKLDLYYADPFLQEEVIIDGIRMASIDDILAMKIDVISRGGRKKDFWDIHELKTSYSLKEMLDLHQQRYPFLHSRMEIEKRFVDFTSANEDFEPICLRGNYWEIIKLDMMEFINQSHL